MLSLVQPPPCTRAHNSTVDLCPPLLLGTHFEAPTPPSVLELAEPHNIQNYPARSTGHGHTNLHEVTKAGASISSCTAQTPPALFKTLRTATNTAKSVFVLKVFSVGLLVFVRACAVESHSRGSFPLYNLFSESASHCLSDSLPQSLMGPSLRSVVRSCVCVCARMLRSSAPEALHSRFNLVSDSAHSLFRVRSSASVSCGILVALNSTEPRAPTLRLVLGL